MRRELVETRGIRFNFEPLAGLLVDLAVEDGRRTIAPLHRAP